MRKIAIFLLVSALLLSLNCAPKPTVPTSGNVSTKLRFDDGTARSGINFRHVPTRTAEKWMPQIMGSGVGIIDVNRDGAPDVVLVNSGAMRATERSVDARTRLYVNDGHGNFTDDTDKWKLPSAGYGMGVAVGDFDNDGWPDLFLTTYDGKDLLLRNTGTEFTDVTAKAGVQSDGKWSTSAGFFDLENDGDLDLFLVRYIDYSPENAVKTYRNGVPTYSTPILYQPVPDRLFRNNGNGTFTDVSQTAGLSAAARKGLALALGDIDLDGDTDIYVANDTNPNQLWLNDGKGGLRDVAALSGVAYSEAGAEEGSMGADFSDYDGNGLLDIICANFQTETTALYQQDQPLLFREVSDAVGIGEAARGRLKFGIDFFDADNDGDEDLLVANGHIEDNIEQNSSTVTFAQLNSLYENLGNGKFSDVSAVAGRALADQQVSRSLVTADLDGDGDLDFIVTNNGGTAQVGINSTEEKNGFVILWLEGGNANRSAIGARVLAKVGGRTIQRQVMGAQSYLSVSDLRLHFGLGSAFKIDELTVYWPGGETQVFRDLGGGSFYHLVQGRDPVKFIPGAVVIAP
ncbi:MAG: CRTAC1 family protein [Pyrinomonadaceae bacterium]